MSMIKIRRTLLFGFFLLTPIIQFYFSPYVPIKAALGGGIAISLVVFLSLFLLGMFLGRAPCGWIMPCGGLQEACFYLNDHRIAAGKKDKIKFAIWLLWLILLLTFLLSHGVVHLNLFYALEHGISVSQPLYYIPYYGAILIVVGLCIGLGKRALCHYGCWIAPFMVLGRKIGDALRVPGLRLMADQRTCIGCHACTKICPMGLDVEQMVKSGRLEHPECILCTECSHACQTRTIQLTFCKPT